MGGQTPSYRAVLRQGVRTADDYTRLTRALVWDASNQLVTAEQAEAVLSYAMPPGLRASLDDFLSTDDGKKAFDALVALRDGGDDKE